MFTSTVVKKVGMALEETMVLRLCDLSAGEALASESWQLRLNWLVGYFQSPSLCPVLGTFVIPLMAWGDQAEELQHVHR